MHMADTVVTETFPFCRNESFLCLGAGPASVPLVATDPATAKEYEKTAAAVAAAPWRLDRAAAYLRVLVAEPPAPEPLSVGWLWSAQPPRPLWPATVAAEDFHGIGENKEPGPLMVHDRLAESGKRKRTTECPGGGVAAPAVGAALAEAPPPLAPKALPVAPPVAPMAPPPKAAPEQPPDDVAEAGSAPGAARARGARGWPRMGPRMVTRGPEVGPRGPKMGPRWPRDGAKSVKDGPKMASGQ